MIAILDYGVGNLFSVQNALDYLNIPSIITCDAKELCASEAIILPGVGAFKNAMQALESTGLIPLITELVQEQKPFLGICLGMQLLYESSEEHGDYAGLGFIEGKVKDLRNVCSQEYKIPHMGWNALEFSQKAKLTQRSKQGDEVYFVHSYYVVSQGTEVLATTHHGVSIPAIIQKDSVYGMQFHPEKSGNIGLELLKSFYDIVIEQKERKKTK